MRKSKLHLSAQIQPGVAKILLVDDDERT